MRLTSMHAEFIWGEYASVQSTTGVLLLQVWCCNELNAGYAADG